MSKKCLNTPKGESVSTKLLLQKTESGLLAPHAEPDQDILKDYHVNEILQGELTGTRKPRSLQQLKAYWKLCSIVSNNSDRPEYATPALVDWRLRNALQFFDHDFIYANTKTGQVSVKVRSISYKNLKHADANGYFDRAFELISKSLKIPMDELIRQTGK